MGVHPEANDERRRTTAHDAFGDVSVPYLHLRLEGLDGVQHKIANSCGLNHFHTHGCTATCATCEPYSAAALLTPIFASSSPAA